MYIIIKKDKAEQLTERLHKLKAIACDVMEELTEAQSKTYDRDELRDVDHARHRDSGFDPRRRDDYDYDRDPYFEPEHARGRGRRMGRY